jgi:hypothetical protein
MIQVIINHHIWYYFLCFRGGEVWLCSGGLFFYVITICLVEVVVDLSRCGLILGCIWVLGGFDYGEVIGRFSCWISH